MVHPVDEGEVIEHSRGAAPVDVNGRSLWLPGTARLFLMPFCVSSFAALIKGHGFVLVFHPSWRDNLIAIAACALFVTASLVLRAVAGTALSGQLRRA